MLSPTNPWEEDMKKPKYAVLVEFMNKLKDKEAQKNKKSENRTQMQAKKRGFFKFTE